MSPEQAQGKALDPRSDLYAVGVLLYHLLTGRPPFVDDDAVVVMAKHIREKPDPLRKAAPDRNIPAVLERAVLRSMQKEPDARYESCEAFERALAECADDVLAERAAAMDGRSSFADRVSQLPRIPLAIGGAVVLLAIVVSAIVVASPGPSVASSVTVLPPAAPIATPAAIVPAPLPPPRPLAPATRSIVVDSEPPRAEIWRGGERIATAPATIDLVTGETGRLELRLAGHETATLDLATAGPVQTVTLVPERRAAVRRTPERGRPEATATTIAPPETPPRTTAPTDPYERFE
jgi:serine/threonine-protein kinase